MSCTEAYLSRYGSVAGVPVAVGGVMFFAVVIAIVGLTGGKSRENVPGYVFALSTLALAFVLYLGWASYVVLKVFCILCAVTYAAVIGIFLISGGATSFPMKTWPTRARRDLKTLVSSPLALVVALVLFSGAVMAVSVFPREVAASSQAAAAQAVPLPAVTDEQRAQLAKWWEVQPKVDVPVPADGAKVLIVKFNDYQCPACKITFDGYSQILPKYIASGQVKYVTKHYPLEPECNPYVPGGNHYASCEAAAAVLMAKARGSADKLEEWIFSHIGPPALTPDQVKDAARTVGGITDFDAQYARVKDEIKTDAGLGQLLGVKSTPTFYINGRTPTQILPPQYFEILIQLELQGTK
jgi:protein-disulfide isomerase